uniref:LysM peptidoglycan-binding domain-containing protein n=1 Tax=Flavobacterium sp. TaxID=239 RepID=UPI00404B01F9
MNKLLLVVCFLFIAKGFSQESFVKYTVNKGETVTQIAKKFDTSVDAIYKLNPESRDGLKLDQIIFVSTQNLNTHVVKPKETVYGIALKYDITIEELKKVNPEIVSQNIIIGQKLSIPKHNKVIARALELKEFNKSTLQIHEIKPKETLFSIARLYNVSVEDLDHLNAKSLENGLQIGQKIQIPTKKKTLDGKPRVITKETFFHTVLPQETKYGIAKKYNISIAQLELQNPEIVSGLIEGNKLAINTNAIHPKNEKEELMLVIAEKQVVVEKSKNTEAEVAQLKVDKKESEAKLAEKTAEIENLEDIVAVQKEMNQKVLKINALNIDLNRIQDSNSSSSEKLKLVLEANRNIQEVLLYKLDSLVYNMKLDVEDIKNREIVNVAESRQLEKEANENLQKTNILLVDLKQDFASNRKNYALIMNKVKKVNLEEAQILKKNTRKLENERSKEEILYDFEKLEAEQQESDKQNEVLLSKMESLTKEADYEVKRKIKMATFYSEEARIFDDKLALEKIKRYKNNKVIDENVSNNDEEIIEDELLNDDVVLVKTVVLDYLKDVENGYYMVFNTYKNAIDRDKKVLELIDKGEIEASFFYDFTTFTYYVYSKKFIMASEALNYYKKIENNAFYKDITLVNCSYITYNNN